MGEGIASIKKGTSPLWFGYPPGVFIGYKWDGKPMHDLVVRLAEHIRGLGYQAFLDVENLDESADAYFHIPTFITSLHECSFYLLLLTELAADIIDARKHKASWLFDEYQHALRLVNSGRLFLVPALLEKNGALSDLTAEQMLDLTATPRDFDKLRGVLTPNPISLGKVEVAELAASVARFDELFLGQQWDASDEVLRTSSHLAHTFDHQFRRVLHSIYTANQASVEVIMPSLQATYGTNIILHIYGGYCEQHRIPKRLTKQ